MTRPRPLSVARLIAWFLTFGALALGAAPGFTTTLLFTSIHSFAATSSMSPYGNTDGASPMSALTEGSDGNFYGTTENGGSSGEGVVFEVTPSGTLTTLANFSGTNGGYPSASLALGSDGNFYGTAQQGGTSGTGVVFKVTPSGTLTVLHSFSAVSGSGENGDGADPIGGLVLGSDGDFYGTTQQGGTAGTGVVFKVTPSGTLTVLHSFSAVSGSGENGDGAFPASNLILASGTFYGTTQGGGESGYGVIFSMTSSGTLTNLAHFTDTNGSQPNALTQGSDGNFYGTTVYGGTNGFGTAFQMAPDGTLSILANFNDTTLGGNPYAPLVQGSDGNFYGSVFEGGPNGDGLMFSMTSSGAFTTQHAFSAIDDNSENSDGAYPVAGLILGSDGTFYGTTEFGGQSGTGTIFTLSTVLPPIINSFSPTSGPSGTVVTILGSNLGNMGGIVGVRFHNADSIVYSANAAGTQLMCTVPKNAATGTITVTTLGGYVKTAKPFTVPLPVITSYSPISGPVGTVVVINGSYMKGTKTVRFHNMNATTFSVNGTGTQLKVTVPSGAGTGPITVTTPAGYTKTPGDFSVT